MKCWGIKLATDGIFIDKGTSQSIKSTSLHTTIFVCISSDPTAEPYFKDISKCAQLCMTQGAKIVMRRLASNYRAPLIRVNLKRNVTNFRQTRHHWSQRPQVMLLASYIRLKRLKNACCVE